MLRTLCVRFTYPYLAMVHYPGSNISSIVINVNVRLAKALTANDSLCNLTNKISRDFFLVGVVSELMYRCPTRTLTKRLEKKLDGNYTIMLLFFFFLNKSWKQHSTKQQLFGHLLPISQTIEIKYVRGTKVRTNS